MSRRNLGYKYTVDWEIFMLKIICVTNFCVVKFWLFCSICKNFVVVNDCNMDKRLESSWHLVYYQVSGEQGIAAVVVDQTFTLGSVDLHASSFTDHHRVILFFACLIFVVGLNYKIILTMKFF